MDSPREDLAHYAEEARKYGAPAAVETKATPAGWMVNHPDDFRISDDGQFLEWDKDSRRGNRRVPPDALLLDRFLRLADGGAEDVLAFARSYGPLVPGISLTAGLPSQFDFAFPPRLETIVELRPIAGDAGNLLRAGRWRLESDVGVHPSADEFPAWVRLPARRESVEGWRALASEARAFLSIANRLHKSAPQLASDWAALNGRADPESERDRDAIVASGGWVAPAANLRRVALANEFRGWSAGAIRGIGIHWWDSAVPEVGIEGFGLFGTIVVRVAAGIARGSRYDVCTAPHCDRIVSVRQDARRKYGPFCDLHRQSANNLSRNASRAKLRAEARARGVTEAEIKRERAAQRAARKAARDAG